MGGRGLHASLRVERGQHDGTIGIADDAGLTIADQESLIASPTNVFSPPPRQGFGQLRVDELRRRRFQIVVIWRQRPRR